MRIYVDLDNVLIDSIIAPNGTEALDIIVRPDTPWFLRRLKDHGKVWLLTAAERGHVAHAFRVMGSTANIFQGVLSREDLEPVEKNVIRALSGEGSWKDVRPIAPRGVMFDDYPVNSLMYLVKGNAIGIDPSRCIQVEPFHLDRPEKGGLRKAYAEFTRQFVRPSVLGRVLAWR